MKYELTNETMRLDLYRPDKPYVILRRIKYANGKKGGWLEGYRNLNNCGKCVVLDNAMVFDEARVCEEAIVRGNARVFQNARVEGKAIVEDEASISGHAGIADNVILRHNSKMYDNAIALHNCILEDQSQMYHYAMILGNLKLKKESCMVGGVHSGTMTILKTSPYLNFLWDQRIDEWINKDGILKGMEYL